MTGSPTNPAKALKALKLQLFYLVSWPLFAVGVIEIVKGVM